jgi:hypothetical protein
MTQTIACRTLVLAVVAVVVAVVLTVADVMGVEAAVVVAGVSLTRMLFHIPGTTPVRWNAPGKIPSWVGILVRKVKLSPLITGNAPETNPERRGAQTNEVHQTRYYMALLQTNSSLPGQTSPKTQTHTRILKTTPKGPIRGPHAC